MRSDQRARFEAMFAEHFDAVLRFALARSAPDVAPDITAETFAAAWYSIDKVPPEPLAWLLAVARRKIVDHYRMSGRRDALHASMEAFAATSGPDVGDLVVEHERIRSALATLPPQDQELLQLLAWDGLCQSEAAVVLGCSPVALRVRLSRARRRLRAALTTSDSVRAGESTHLITTQEPS